MPRPPHPSPAPAAAGLALWGLAALAALVGAACDADPEAERQARFLAALPTELTLAVRAPGDEDLVTPAAAPRPGVFEGGLSALPSSYHQRTVIVTSKLDGALRGLAAGLRAVVAGRRPTSATDSRLLWRTQGTQGVQRALVIERDGDDGFTFQTLRRDAGGAWRTVIAGEHTPSGRVGHGQGALWVDLDADGDAATTGTILGLWSTLGGKRTLTAFLYGWRPAPGEALLDAVYHYIRRGDGSGLLVFGAALELLERPGGALEEALIITRWAPGGAGRADARGRGGDLAAEGAEGGGRTQCWRAGDFEVVYDETALKPVGKPLLSLERFGDAAECAFPAPADAILPPLGLAPELPAPVDDPALE